MTTGRVIIYIVFPHLGTRTHNAHTHLHRRKQMTSRMQYSMIQSTLLKWKSLLTVKRKHHDISIDDTGVWLACNLHRPPRGIVGSSCTCSWCRVFPCWCSSSTTFIPLSGGWVISQGLGNQAVVGSQGLGNQAVVGSQGLGNQAVVG